VLEFFAPEPKQPDEDLLQAMAHIGTQLGRVFERISGPRLVCFGTYRSAWPTP
jgi:hypothetical protein